MVYRLMRRAEGLGNVGVMDIMQQAPALTLTLLALIDATSIGTLVIPIWLLLRRNYREVIPKVLLYLLVLAGFYWVVGVLLRAGWQLGQLGGLGTLIATPAAQWVKLVLGLGLLGWALLTPSKRQSTAPTHLVRSERSQSEHRPPANQHSSPVPELAVAKSLRGRLATALDSYTGVVALALVAGLLELPTMLPYLGALGLMESLGWQHALQLVVLVFYCVVMILPALLLVLLRRVTGNRVEALLGRIGHKLNAFAAESLLWVAGVVGFLLLRSAALELGVFGFLS